MRKLKKKNIYTIIYPIIYITCLHLTVDLKCSKGVGCQQLVHHLVHGEQFEECLFRLFTPHSPDRRIIYFTGFVSSFLKNCWREAYGFCKWKCLIMKSNRILCTEIKNEEELCRLTEFLQVYFKTIMFWLHMIAGLK